MLAILTDPIWTWMFGEGIIGALFSLAVPTALIVIFGEIIPQAYCGRNALFVGALSVPLVIFFIVATLPLTYPISKLLDCILGREISGVFSRQMLLELVSLNVDDEEHAKQSGLTKEDGKLLKGALTFKDRMLGDVMTPLDSCYFLPEGTLLDRAMFEEILRSGHTRIPVYSGEKSNVIALLFCKDLLGIGFERKASLSELLEAVGASQRVERIARSTTLNVAMEHCKRARKHMLCIVDDDAKVEKRQMTRKSKTGRSVEPPAVVRSDAPVVGLATMEDLIEELIQDEIVDEDDVWHYERQESRQKTEKTAVKNTTNQRDAAAHLRKMASTEVQGVQVSMTA